MNDSRTAKQNFGNIWNFLAGAILPVEPAFGGSRATPVQIAADL
jgi:hypothetical protein